VDECKPLVPTTVLKTGRSRCVVPPFLGVTPPTICVPYAMACSLWNDPFLPVNPSRQGPALVCSRCSTSSCAFVFS